MTRKTNEEWGRNRWRVVEADNKEQAWEKAMEGGLMSESGKLDDMYVNKFEVEEVSDE